MAIRWSQALSILAAIAALLAGPVWAESSPSSGRGVAHLASESLPEEAVPVVVATDSQHVATLALESDPAKDPWLSERGPANPVPVEIPKEKVLDAWQRPGSTLDARATSVRRARLEFGLGDQLAPAMALLRAAPDAQDREVYTALAREMAPGVPSIQMADARALWQAGDTGAAIHSLARAGLDAATNLEVRLWWIENLALILVIVGLGSSFGFMLLAALMVFPHAAHDLGDLISASTPNFARSAALAALLIVPLVLGEGVVGTALALFGLAFAYGKSRQRNALVMAAVLFVVGLYPMARLASVASTLSEQDPILNSVLSVANGVETRADLERLEQASEEDLIAAHALAYRARRYGLDDEARQRLDQIAVNHPGDVVMLTNRGNIEMRRGRNEKAIEFYTKASTLVDSPTILFDLSQAYASSFRMDESEATLARGQIMGDREIAALSSLGDAALVSDLGLPFGILQQHLVSKALAQAPKTTVAEALAPGHLGGGGFITASAFALVALFALLVADRFDHASVCTRCGHRICTRCEETVWSDELCEDCHHLFQNVEETDPSLRMARLQSLSRREVRIDRIWIVASLLIPGVAGFASRQPDLAMFGLLLFGWTATWLAWPTGILMDPMLMGSAAWVSFAIPGGLMMLAYIGVVLASLVARKNL